MPLSSIAPATDSETAEPPSRDYWLRMASVQRVLTAIREQVGPPALLDAARRLQAEIGWTTSPLDWWHRFRLMECEAAREQVKLTGYRRDAWTQPLSLLQQRRGRILLELMEHGGDDDFAAGTGVGTDRSLVASS